jgi:hypothetical protein
MSNRPLTVTIIAWIYVAVGAGGFALHASEILKYRPFQSDVLWVLGLSLLAIVCGVWMLRGCNWARWLAVAWLAFHVAISAFHTRQELIVHSVLLVVFAYLLFRPEATAYFRAANRRDVNAASSR